MFSLLRAIAAFILQLIIFAVLPLSVLSLLYLQGILSSDSLFIGYCLSAFLAFVVFVYSARDIYKSYVFSYNFEKSIKDFQVLFRDEYKLLYTKLVVENDVSEEFLRLAEKNWRNLYEISSEIHNTKSNILAKNFMAMYETTYYLSNKFTILNHFINSQDRDSFTEHFNELFLFGNRHDFFESTSI